MSGIISIKDPVHGIIELNELEGRIIDCQDFQRLRKIKQLATAHLVYPGANHTRFEHSLGTLHLASLICRKLGIEKDEEQKIRLYALLHDLGHIAFSHEAERITKKYLGSHESIGLKKMLSGEIGDIVLENFNKKKMLEFVHSPAAQIISSDIGADRMDYLKRDAHYTGVAYGVIDEERIIGKMYFENNELWLDGGALEASESLLVARFMMFSTVYLHHTVRIASAMLARSLELAIKEGLDPKHLLSLGDSETFSLLTKKKKASTYSLALQNRNLYKEAYVLPSSKLGEKEKEKVEKELCSLCNCDVIIDVPTSFFKLSGFRVKMYDGKMEEIGKISELVRALKFSEEFRKKTLILAPAKYREKVEKICKKYFSEVL